MLRLPSPTQCLIAVGLTVLATASGCPAGGGRGDKTVLVHEGFECNDRRIEYIVAGGFAADEAGISVQCTDNKPTVIKWSQDSGAERGSRAHPISSRRFDDVWEKVDGTGWRHIEEECDNSAANKGMGAKDTDPVYTIEASDHAMTRTLSCQGKTLPFPYDRLVNELDVLAAGLGGP